MIRRAIPLRNRPARSLLRKLRRDTRGNSIIEFAIALPVLVILGMYGTELAYMAVVNMQVSQIASSVADNASRLGQTDNSAVTPSVPRAEVRSVLDGGLEEGGTILLEDRGRIILSSLERDSATGRQYIHWQRCVGDYQHDSKYGKENTGLIGTVLPGLGPASDRITADNNSGVMFAEVYYRHEPLFGNVFFGDNVIIRHESGFLVRDDRNFTPGVTGTGTDPTC